MDNNKPKRGRGRPQKGADEGDQNLKRDAALLDAYGRARATGKTTRDAKQIAAKSVGDQYGLKASPREVERAIAKYQSLKRQQRDGEVILLAHSYQDSIEIPDDVRGVPELEEFYKTAKNIHSIGISVGPRPTYAQKKKGRSINFGKKR